METALELSLKADITGTGALKNPALFSSVAVMYLTKLFSSVFSTQNALFLHLLTRPLQF